MTQLANVHDRGVKLAEGRRGTTAGVLLLLASCLPLLGATLLAPDLARIGGAFQGTAHLTLMVYLVVTAPGAMIAVVATFAGAISDRLGRKRLLVVSCVIYSVFGVAPLLLHSLSAIVVSRALLGLCEGFVMTVCTALIADYFEGARRAKYLALQTVFTSVSAVVFMLAGGAAAQASWRAPFFIYALGIVLAIPLAVFTWEPRRNARPEMAAPSSPAPVPGIPWGQLALPIAFTLYTGIANGVITLNMSFMLPARGFTTDPGAIGLVSAAFSLSIAVAALAFRWGSGYGPRRLLTVAFLAQGLGLMVVTFVANVPGVIVGGLLAQSGFGVQLPTLITWALSRLADDRTRGRASGLWTSAFWFGQLLFSFVFTGLIAITGGLFEAVAAFGTASGVMALLAFAFIPPGTAVVVLDDIPTPSVH